MPDSLDAHSGGSQIITSTDRLENGIVLSVRGEFDIAAAPIVEQELLRAEESYDLVGIDLSEAPFIDSTGLSIIVAAHRRLVERGGRLVVVAGPSQVQRLFDLTGVGRYVEVLKDPAELEQWTAAHACGA
jgi:anti-anti-sigma factor